MYASIHLFLLLCLSYRLLMAGSLFWIPSMVNPVHERTTGFGVASATVIIGHRRHQLALSAGPGGGPASGRGRRPAGPSLPRR